MGSTNITSGNAKKALLSALDVIGKLPPNPARDITAECNDLLASKNRRIDELEAELAAANAKIAELQQSATKLEEVLSVVRSSLMEHGDCKSHLRYSNGLPMACTACMARIKLSEMVSEWKGPTVKLAAAFAAKEE